MGQLPLSTPISTEQMSINIIILVKLYSVENRQERVEAPCPPQGLFEGNGLDLSGGKPSRPPPSCSCSWRWWWVSLHPTKPFSPATRSLSPITYSLPSRWSSGSNCYTQAPLAFSVAEPVWQVDEIFRINRLDYHDKPGQWARVHILIRITF